MKLTRKMRDVLDEIDRRGNRAGHPANGKTIHALARRGLVAWPLRPLVLTDAGRAKLIEISNA